MDTHESKIYITVLITCFLLGIIISYFIISLVRHQRTNLELTRKNILAEITAIEKERARIANDLHDELGPMLAAVKMKMNSFDLTNEEDKVQIEKTNDHIDGILKRMREISFDLTPQSLLQKGLVPALFEFINYLHNQSKMKIHFTHENNCNPKEDQSINIYRITQEVLHNIIKHSRATEVMIDLKMKKKNLVINFTDNGIGFDFQKVSSETTGFGLKSILNRTLIMKGEMIVESIPGRGTFYQFEIPQI